MTVLILDILAIAFLAVFALAFIVRTLIFVGRIPFVDDRQKALFVFAEHGIVELSAVWAAAVFLFW